MKRRKKLNLGLILLSVVFVAAIAKAEDDIVEKQLVEVEIVQDNLAPYKFRRDPYSINFSIQYEALELKNYLSTLDEFSTYEQMFNGEALPLISLAFSYQYNFFLGSLGLGAHYGMGSLSGSMAGLNRTLDINKYGAEVRFTADMILNEPYVAPYIAAQFWQMGITEKSPTDSVSATTQWGNSYKAGLLIQLNWIDRETARLTTFSWGLENTYADVFMAKYGKTNALEDPNTETDFIYGAGLHLEF